MAASAAADVPMSDTSITGISGTAASSQIEGHPDSATVEP